MLKIPILREMNAQHPPFDFFPSYNDINNTANDVWILPLQQEQQQWQQQHRHHSLPRCYSICCVHLSRAWLVINVFMLLQRLIYGYISLVLLLLLFSYYFAIFASSTSAGASSSSSSHLVCTRQAQQKQIFTMLSCTERKTFRAHFLFSLPFLARLLTIWAVSY